MNEYPAMLNLILTIIPTVLSLSLFGYILFRVNKTRVVYSLLIFQGASFVWALGNMLEVLAADHLTKWYAIQISSIPLNFAGVIWLYFCTTYTNRKLFAVKWRAFCLILPSIIGEILCITNNYHHLYFSNDQLLTAGSAGQILAALSAIYVSVALSYLFKYTDIPKTIARKRTSYFLVFSAVIPLLLELLYIIDVSFLSHTIRLRFLPCFSFSITSVFMIIILFKYRFLNLIPLVRKDIVDNMSEAIIIVDKDGKIVSFNDAFLKNFSTDEKVKPGKDFQIFIEYLKKEADSNAENRAFFDSLTNFDDRKYSAELILKSGQCFLVTVKPIFAFKSEVVGVIISLADITEYKRLKEAEAELNVLKERNQLAREVHDTLGHTLTLVIMLMKVCKINCETNIPETREKLTSAIEIAQEGLQELRRSIMGLSLPDKEKGNNIFTALEKLIESAEKSGLNIDFSVFGEEFYQKNIEIFNAFDFYDSIYKVCQEAITNSLRHGQATNVSIILRFTPENLVLYIIDNGKGCGVIKKGFGLAGIEQRVGGLGGTVIYGSDGEQGFNIHVEIPIQLQP
jgi:PAS domain S-box-containing protein